MIAFVHVAKTAGSSVNTLLRSANGAKHCASEPLWLETPDTQKKGQVLIRKYMPNDIRTLLDLAPGTESIGGHHVALWSDVEKVVPQVTYLLFLRDPLKRAASHYQYNRQRRDMTPFFGQKHLSWDQWCSWSVHHNHQAKMLSRIADPNEAINNIAHKNVFVGLADRFDESLVLFKALFAQQLRIAYQRENTAADNKIAHSVLGDERKVAQIKEMHSNEFPIYDYVTNEVYPRYIRAYGPRLTEDVSRFRESQKDNVNNFNLLKYRLYRRLIFAPRYRRYMQSLPKN